MARRGYLEHPKVVGTTLVAIGTNTISPPSNTSAMASGFYCRLAEVTRAGYLGTLSRGLSGSPITLHLAFPFLGSSVELMERSYRSKLR